jgi:hypothetical protein
MLSEATKNKIKGFIEGDESMLELVKLPIHLDALCYSWDELKRDSWSGGILTITMLY